MRRKETPSHIEEWPERDELIRTVVKGVYGDNLSDEKVEELRRSKVGETPSSLKIYAEHILMIGKMMLKGFTAKKVLRRIDTILEPLEENERQVTHLIIGIQHGLASTKEQAAERLNTTPQSVETLVASAAQKLVGLPEPTLINENTPSESTEQL